MLSYQLPFAGCSRHRGTHCLLMAAGEAESSDEAHSAGAPEPSAGSPESESRGGGKGLQFSDKDEHMYFWFPLLAGLSELTFDPRPDIRYSALEVRQDRLYSAHPSRITILTQASALSQISRGILSNST